jgi:SAM-dependent methyltransferase
VTRGSHIERNRRQWTTWAERHAEPGRRAWAAEEPNWGIWSVPEAELRVLPEVAGTDVLELGCGTAYWSAWLARRGARVTGLDLTAAQLETARELQQEFGLEFPLIEANAEEVPFPDASFDIVLSEYGASIWADPYRWVPEAARLLRPGGRLLYLVNSCLILMCMPDEETVLPAEERLLRPYFGMHRFEWKSDESVNFGLPHGEWIRLLRENGLTVERLIEIQAPEGPPAKPWDLATREWARRWPPEDIWVARKHG